MIFASDLDRTLIYSKRFIDNSIDYLLVETKEDEEISYMTRNAYRNLKKITNSIDFIPITARNKGEFDRIFALKDLPIKYVITNNGAGIHIDNKLDKGWNDYIKSKVQYMKVSYDEIMNDLLEVIPKEEYIKHRLNDDYVWFILMEHHFNRAIFDKLLEKEKYNEWKLYISNRKLYLMPKFINKWEALNYINIKYLDLNTYTAGDSTVDEELVSNSDIGIVPIHGDLLNNFKKTVHTTKKEGILAGEEITNIILDYIKENKSLKCKGA